MQNLPDIIDTITRRKSIRTYARHTLTEHERLALVSAIRHAHTPFGGKPEIKLIHFDTNGPVKPGTYGIISGATDFIVMTYDNGMQSKISAGYMMEQVILKATEIGLGTCWIAATFAESSFTAKANFDNGRSVRIVSPVGIPATRPRMLNKLMMAVVSSDKRKPFDSLFFINDFNTPLSETHRLQLPLEMMRLAPSSTNSQPWRAIVVDNTAHFYYRTKSHLALIDMGIGLCHFDTVCRATKLNGLFSNAPHPQAPIGLDYLTSYIFD